MRRLALCLLTLFLSGTGTLVPIDAAHAGTTQDAHSQYGYPYPNAPDCDEYGPSGCVADAWGFFQGQCTSWVAYRLNQLNGVAFNNSYGGVRWGDASNWGAAARSLGIPVNGTPAKGAVVWYASGHVGYVEQVNSDGSVLMSEMNQNRHNNFQLVTIRSGSRWPSGFIHVRDLPDTPSAPTEGSLVSNNGYVYRIAGGAPLYVSTWDAVGGPQPTLGLNDAQFAQLQPYPADGTTVDTQTGAVYVFAGGAPLYVSNWDHIGGSRPSIRVDQAALDQGGNPNPPWNHVRHSPADGTAVNTQTGEVYVFAGGAPLYVSNWDHIGGPRASTRVDQGALDEGGNPNYPYGHVARHPVDGTAVNTQTGAVYVFAGGAPLYVSSWGHIGGPRPSTRVDQNALDRGGDNSATWKHVRRYPMDGTAVETQSGEVFVFAGGAPLYVSNWDSIGGPRPTARVDQSALDHGGDGDYPYGHVTRYPVDGTVLNGLGEVHSWLVNAGIPEPVARQEGVAVDEEALRNAGLGSPWNHLRSSTPSVALEPLPRTSPAREVALAWSAPLAASAVSTFDLRWKRGADGRWRGPDAWRDLEVTTVSLALPRRDTKFCFAVRGHNRAGLVGQWSGQRCTKYRP